MNYLKTRTGKKKKSSWPKTCLQPCSMSGSNRQLALGFQSNHVNFNSKKCYLSLMVTRDILKTPGIQYPRPCKNDSSLKQTSSNKEPGKAEVWRKHQWQGWIYLNIQRKSNLCGTVIFNKTSYKIAELARAMGGGVRVSLRAESR